MGETVPFDEWQPPLWTRVALVVLWTLLGTVVASMLPLVPPVSGALFGFGIGFLWWE